MTYVIQHRCQAVRTATSARKGAEMHAVPPVFFNYWTWTNPQCRMYPYPRFFISKWHLRLLLLPEIAGVDLHLRNLQVSCLLSTLCSQQIVQTEELSQRIATIVACCRISTMLHHPKWGRQSNPDKGKRCHGCTCGILQPCIRIAASRSLQ